MYWWMEVNFGSYWDKCLIAELITLFFSETQWVHPARVCNFQFTTVFQVLSFSWVYLDRKCFVEKTRDAASTATNNFLPEPGTSPSPAGHHHQAQHVLPGPVGHQPQARPAGHYYQAQRAIPDPVLPHYNPHHTRPTEVQENAEETTRTGSVLCAVISNTMCTSIMSAQHEVILKCFMGF